MPFFQQLGRPVVLRSQKQTKKSGGLVVRRASSKSHTPSLNALNDLHRETQAQHLLEAS